MASTGLSLRDQQRASTRERLLQAAREVFTESGYIDATVEDIAGRAGVSRATFYLHFGGKAELTMALIQKGERWAVERYKELDKLLTSPGGRTRAKLREWLGQWLEPWRGGAAYNAAVAQAASVEPEIEQRLLASSQALIAALEDALEQRSSASRAEARGRALMLEVMTQRLFQLASHDKLPVSDEALLDFLADLWESHFLPPA